MARWMERLAEFEFSVQHRPGETHGNADGMSRIPSNEAEQSVFTNPKNCVLSTSQGSVSRRTTNKEMVLYQAVDAALSQAVSWVKKGE